MSKPCWITHATSLSLVWMLAACADTSTLVDSPSVTLTSLQSGHLSFDRQTFVLGFAISNPNAFPLPVKSFHYNVELAGQKFASGETQSEFTVPAHGDSAFAISVDLDMLQQTSRLASLLRVSSRGEVPYKLDGKLAVNIPFSKPVSFSNSGSISLAGDF